MTPAQAAARARAGRVDQSPEARARRLAKGEHLYLLAAARDEAIRSATADPDFAVVGVAASALARTAREQLRQAAVARAARPQDFEANARLDAAFEALEVAERRAARFGERRSPYGPGSPFSLIADRLRATDQRGAPDKAAAARLARHAEEIELRVGLGLTSDFVAPAYDLASWADIPRPARVLSGLVPTKPLPKGRTLAIPQLTAGGAVAPTVDNTSATEVDIADEYLTSTVALIAGQWTVPLQMLDQQAGPDFDEMATEALTNAFDADLESQLLIGAGTGAELTGLVNTSSIITVSYTSGSPTAVGLLSCIGQALAQVGDARDLPATAILMRPARWTWLATGSDSSNRPLLVPAGPRDATPAVGGTNPVGTIAGTPVYVTSAIPATLGSGSNQDEIIVCRPEDARLYISPGGPRLEIWAEGDGAGSLSANAVLHANVAFVERYPSSVAVVSGTGLVVQSGY